MYAVTLDWNFWQLLAFHFQQLQCVGDLEWFISDRDPAFQYTPASGSNHKTGPSKKTAVLWIRISFNADPDPGSQTNAGPDPDQSLK